jgi:hypothetical protein
MIRDTPDRAADGLHSLHEQLTIRLVSPWSRRVQLLIMATNMDRIVVSALSFNMQHPAFRIDANLSLPGDCGMTDASLKHSSSLNTTCLQY